MIIYINNFNDLILKLVNKKNGEIINSLIIKNIFPDFIREIRYFFFEFDIYNEDEENDSKTNENKIEISNDKIGSEMKNFLLV